MSSKLLLKLPITVGDELRKLYEEHAQSIKNLCYVNSILHNSELNSDASINFMIEVHKKSYKEARQFCQYVQNLEQSNKKSQPILEKYILEKITPIERKANDFVTAFYIPENLTYLKLLANDLVIYTYENKYIDIPIEDILHEHKFLPLQHDVTRLENILWECNQYDAKKMHNQQDEIIVDGITYKRIIPIQPCLPLSELLYQIIKIEVYDEDIGNCIYIETFMLYHSKVECYNFSKKYLYNYDKLLLITRNMIGFP
jgi:hypothetical protein